MEKALSYIAAMKEAISRVILVSTASPLPVPGHRDSRRIIFSLVVHLEEVLAGTSIGPLNVDDLSSEQD